MNQIDTITRAKNYLRELNDGKDPLHEGRYLPKQSAGLDDKVHKLLYYAAQDMEKVIANDTSANCKPFALTMQQRDTLVPEDDKLSLTRIIERINEVVDPSVMRKASEKMLRAWLIREGYVDASQPQVATQKGLEIGLTNSTYQDKPWLLAERSAQQVIFQYFDPSGLSEAEDGTSLNGAAEINNIIAIEEVLLRLNHQGIERLAKGLHPATGQPLAADDPLCQEQTQKCFACVATAMERSLAAGYYTAEVKEPFALPQELRDKIPIYAKEVWVARFSSAVNALLPDPTAVQWLKVSTPLRYLASQGLLDEDPTGSGLSSFRINARSGSIGIVEKEDTTKDGTSYTGLFYGPAAQRYLVEHLDEIIALNAQ